MDNQPKTPAPDKSAKYMKKIISINKNGIYAY